MEIILILALAMALDLALGDPPNAIHPVAWMGKVISFLERAGKVRRPLFQLLYGIVMVAVTMAVFIIPAYYILIYLKSLSPAAYIIVAAVLLKCTFSAKGLQRAALKVKELLEKNKIDEARYELRSLVSRNTDLPEPLVVSATVESVAEGAANPSGMFWGFSNVPQRVLVKETIPGPSCSGRWGKMSLSAPGWAAL